MTTGTFYPLAAGDDGNYWPSTLANAPTLYLGDWLGGDAAHSNGFFRFSAVNIPQGATIDSAILTLTAAGDASAATVNLDVVGNDVDDAVAPATYSEAAALAETTASVEWHGVGGWTGGSAYAPGDLKAIIQEIVDRPGWVSGNALMLIVKDHVCSANAWRSVRSYGETGPAKLDIAWTPAAVVCTPPAAALTLAAGIPFVIPVVAAALSLTLAAGIPQAGVFMYPAAPGLSLAAPAPAPGMTARPPAAALALAAGVPKAGHFRYPPAAALALAAPAPALGMTAHPPAGALTLAKHDPAYVWAIPPNSRAVNVIYLCVLTGAPDGLADLELPMSSFQGTLRDGDPSYLACVIPNSADYAAAIAARPNGEIVVSKGYRFSDGTRVVEEIARVDYESLAIDRGGRSDSATISGHKTVSSTAGKQRALTGVSFYGLQVDGKRRVRSDIDHFLRIGDEALYTLDGASESLVVGHLTYIVNDVQAVMEVTEA